MSSLDASQNYKSMESSLREVEEENRLLKAALEEKEETLLAIQSGNVDALVINNDQGSQVFTLQGADYPYRILVENMFEGAATVSVDLEVVYCNHRLEEMLESSYTQIIGKKVESFVYPDDIYSFRRILNMGQYKNTTGEISLISPTGKKVEVLLSCTPLNLENTIVCLVFAELTTIKKAEAELLRINKNLDSLVKHRTAALQTSEQKWVTTLSSIADAVIATDKTGRITFMNPVAETLTGWEFSKAQNKLIENIITFKNKKSRNWIEEILSEGKTLYIAKGDLLIHRDNKREIPIEDRAAPIKNTDGQTTGLVYIFRDISKRKKAEQRLRRSEERFRILITATSEVVFRMNPDWSKIKLMQLGYPEDFSEVLFEEYISELLPPDTQEIVKKEIQKAIQKKTIFEMEHPVYARDGSINWMSTRAVPLIDENNEIIEWFGTSADISDRKKTEDALKESQQRWETTLASIGDAVISTDPNGNITFINRAAEKLIQWDRAEVLRKPVTDFLKIFDENFYPVKFIKIKDLKTDEVTDKYFLANREGRKISIEYNASAINANGQDLGGVLIFRDITSRKEIERVIKEYNLQLERTVKERTAQLEMAKERAESADKLKTAFLLNMSHELRTPLNSIIGFSGILLNKLAGPVNPEQEKQLNMILRSGRHLLSLISDILDISKIEAGELLPDYSEFDLMEVIKDVINLVKPTVEDKNLSLIFDYKTPLIISSDKIRIRQVLINLVYNAVKFTEKGEVKIKCFNENQQVRLEVSDTGIGIKEEDIDKLFNPFIQLENNLTRRFEGSGLGLSISKKIIDMLHGSITVSSEYGKGSVFSITLPSKPE